LRRFRIVSSRAQDILSAPERIRFINNIGALVLSGEVKGDDFLRTLGVAPILGLSAAMASRMGTSELCPSEQP